MFMVKAESLSIDCYLVSLENVACGSGIMKLFKRSNSVAIAARPGIRPLRATADGPCIASLRHCMWAFVETDALDGAGRSTYVQAVVASLHPPDLLP
jgi:hypothetical protein